MIPALPIQQQRLRLTRRRGATYFVWRWTAIAKLMGVSPDTAQKWARHFGLPIANIGGMVVTTRPLLDRWNPDSGAPPPRAAVASGPSVSDQVLDELEAATDPAAMVGQARALLKYVFDVMKIRQAALPDPGKVPYTKIAEVGGRLTAITTMLEGKGAAVPGKINVLKLPYEQQVALREELERLDKLEQAGDEP